MAGTLFIVATPIGNLGDITKRAAETLAAADVIAAEDTRHTRKLTSALGISARFISLHEYSEPARISEVVELLLAGKNVALVSDAGTPVVSDPGYALVAAAAERGITVTPVPGACAAVSALCVSDIPSRQFLFLGFLPRDNTRKAALRRLAESEYTSVVYESPHHLQATLDELSLLMPERRVTVCRELTKLHEEVLRTTIIAAKEHFAANEPRGEFVLVIAGRELVKAEVTDADIFTALERRFAAGDRTKQAAAAVAEELGVSKNRVYAIAVNGGA